MLSTCQAKKIAGKINPFALPAHRSLGVVWECILSSEAYRRACRPVRRSFNEDGRVPVERALKSMIKITKKALQLKKKAEGLGG